MTNLFKYEILIGGRWCEITDVQLYEQVNADEKQYFRILRERQQKKPVTFLPGVSGAGFDELGF